MERSEDEFISKTRRKKQMTRLQQLGTELVRLSPEQLARIEMPEALRDAVLECKRFTKHEAIRCYTSQVTRRPGEDPTLVSSPDSLGAIDARDRFHGAMIGTSHGEPFRAANTPGLVDPVDHFRRNAFGDAHFFEALR